MNDQRRGKMKWNGRNAAADWLRTAGIEHMIKLAGCELEYGETLNDLIGDGFKIPSSSDRDFSWGFFRSSDKTTR